MAKVETNMQTLPSQADIRAATGSDFCYPYEALPVDADISMIRAYCKAQRTKFAAIAKAFDDEANSRWVLRHYLAIKFITASNMLAGSAAYAYDHNLMLGVPYFNYYAVLNACRAYLMTSPNVEWSGNKTVEMTHQNIINRTADYMRDLDPSRRQHWKWQLLELRESRELFSYRFPLSGPGLTENRALDHEGATDLARLIAELASLNSECFQAALRKHAKDNFSVPEIPDHAWASAYDLSGASMPDFDDLNRFYKYVRGWKTVSTLQVMTFDGLIDDIYGNWSDADEEAGNFDPDRTHSTVLAL